MSKTFNSLDIAGRIVLAGAGKMGGAMLQGWLARGVDSKQIVIVEPNPSPDIQDVASRGARLNPLAAEIGPAAVLILAVKPQMFAEAAGALRSYVNADTLVLSIMAGTTIAQIAKFCGGRVVRAMPNTPAAIGRGITVAVAAADVGPKQRALVNALLEATGSVEWVEDEKLIDAVTAVSGSGPAYVFLLAEEMARAGVAAGLPQALATKLARETVSGAGELLRQSDQDSATLRQNVTSPGGTTAAALAVLMGEGGFQTLLTRAVAEAKRRSQELAG